MSAGDHSFMGGQEGMHKERAGIPSWPLVTCSCSYIAGPHIPEAGRWAGHHITLIASMLVPVLTCCGGMYSFRTGMVHPSSQLRFQQWRLSQTHQEHMVAVHFLSLMAVSTRMARDLAPNPFHSEGTIAHSHSSSTLGTPVEVQMHMFQVGQHGSSRHPQEQDIRGPATHAPAALFGVLCSIL